MNMDKPQPARRWFRFALIAVLLAVAVGFYLTGQSGSDPLATDQQQATFSAKRGPLTISVSEAGTVRPRDQIIIKSEVEGQPVILYLIDEGTEVDQGELLVELDSSQLVEQQAEQRIRVINAEATFIGARENLAVVKSQAQADLDQARQDLTFARQDLEQYQEGEYPKLEKEAQAQITLAEETLANAANTYQWSEKLFAEKYISEAELKSDELTWRKAGIDLDLARDELELLQNFTFQRRMTELTSAVRQTELALDRVERKGAADIVQAEAKLKASKAELAQQQDKLEKVGKQIANTKIYAPRDGTVIYASSTQMSWRGNSEPLDEGQSVRERQELIYLPTTVAFDAEIKVHESSLKKISPGMSVRLTVDALPDRTFSGRVKTIAPLPDPTSMFMNPDLKVYRTEIEIDGAGSDLRNGMSCRAEIIVDQLQDVVYVPLQSLVRRNGEARVYLVDGDRRLPRLVTPGQHNNRMVHIRDGLAAGDRVLLAPPLTTEQGDNSWPRQARTSDRTAESANGKNQ